ncbi:SWR1-complex protein 4, partial [Cucurbita argyrosperma subsp. sororia]
MVCVIIEQGRTGQCPMSKHQFDVIWKSNITFGRTNVRMDLLVTHVLHSRFLLYLDFFSIDPYNVSQEIERKRALSMVLSQTKQQERKDAEVLAEAKKITESRRDERPPTPAAAPSTLVADNASTLASLRMLPVYLRTYALEQMVQAASSSAGLRTIKRVEQTLQDLSLQNKEAEGSSFREGPYNEAPGTPKDRSFIPDSMSSGGERSGKRDQKRNWGDYLKLHHHQLKLKGKKTERKDLICDSPGVFNICKSMMAAYGFSSSYDINYNCNASKRLKLEQVTYAGRHIFITKPKLWCCRSIS